MKKTAEEMIQDFINKGKGGTNSFILDQAAEIERLKSLVNNNSRDYLVDNDYLRAEITQLKAKLRTLQHDYTLTSATSVSRYKEIERLKQEAKNYSNPLASHQAVVKDSERLRTQLANQEQQLQAYEAQLTLQAEGPASLLERLERQKKDLDYYADENNDLRNDRMQLRARIEELGEALRQSCHLEHLKERDALKQRVEELENQSFEIGSVRDLYTNMHTAVCDERDDLLVSLEKSEAACKENYFACKKAEEERDELRLRVQELEKMQHNFNARGREWYALVDFKNDLVATVADLEAKVRHSDYGLCQLEDELSTAKLERDALKQRVEELEAICMEHGRFANAIGKERDKLHEDARNFSNLFDQLNAKYLALRAELEDVTTNLTDKLHTYQARFKEIEDGDTDLNRVRQLTPILRETLKAAYALADGAATLLTLTDHDWTGYYKMLDERLEAFLAAGNNVTGNEQGDV